MSEIIPFTDLSDYCYRMAPYTLAGVKNIGWLDFKSKFPEGAVPASILNKLRDISANAGDFQPLVEPIREPPCCPICGDLELRDSKGKLLRNAELWIPSKGIIYASPISVIHFIETHHYQPPAEYLDAIAALDQPTSFIGDDEYARLLANSAWGKLSGTEKQKFKPDYRDVIRDA